jgi:hypothetical protein
MLLKLQANKRGKQKGKQKGGKQKGSGQVSDEYLT